MKEKLGIEIKLNHKAIKSQIDKYGVGSIVHRSEKLARDTIFEIAKKLGKERKSAK